MQNIKIKVYGDNGSFIIPESLLSSDFDLNFTSDINSGLSGFDIELNEKFTQDKYKCGDIIEISVFNNETKSGFIVYSGIIDKIGRHYLRADEKIILNIEGLTKIFSEIEVNKTYSGTYQSIVSDIIADVPDNTINAEFLGTTIFKNLITDTATAPDLVLDGNLLKGLQDLFEDKVFFINAKGEITDNFTKKHFIKYGENIIENNIIENKDGIDEVDISVVYNKEINVGDSIKLINSDYVLDDLQITKLDYSLFEKNIKFGNFKNLKIN